MSAKTSEALRLPVSVAVTFRFSVPTSALPGVPLNVRVDGREGQPRRQRAVVSQRGAVGQRIAGVYVREGISRYDEVEEHIFRGALIDQRCGDRRRLIHVTHGEIERVGHARIVWVRRRHPQSQRPHLCVVRRPTERPRHRIETQPPRQRVTIGQARAQRQYIIHVLIRKRIGRHDERQRRTFQHRLIGDRIGHGRNIVRKDRIEIGKINHTAVGKFQCGHDQRAQRRVLIEPNQLDGIGQCYCTQSLTY